MPTTFGFVMMGLLVVLALVGVVLWVRQVKARRTDTSRRALREAPFDEESAGSHQAQRFQGPTG